MKVIHVIEGVLHFSAKGVFANSNRPDFKGFLSLKFAEQGVTAHPGVMNALSNKLTFKSAFSYLFNALIEGLKQNFFGPELNMEFFVLSIHVYIILLTRLVLSNPSNISLKFTA